LIRCDADLRLCFQAGSAPVVFFLFIFYDLLNTPPACGGELHSDTSDSFRLRSPSVYTNNRTASADTKTNTSQIEGQ